MRVQALAVGLAALLLSGPATAQTIETISYGPDFSQALEEDYGAREGAYLSQTLTRYVDEALAQRGVARGDGRIEITIVNATPNHPTFQQLADQPTLDGFASVSRGGATLHAVLHDASGAVIGEVDHRYYAPDIWSSYGLGVWSDAERSMRRFADKIADAYAAS